jgi:sulfonate transport system substrate-binding protein
MAAQHHPNHAAQRRTLLKAAAAVTLGTGTALAGGAAALLSSQAARAEGNAKTLRIGYQKYGNFVLLRARGTLEKRLAAQGTSVQWLEFPAGPQLLEGLNAGAVDVGTVGETPPIFAQAAGVDFVYIASEPPAPRGEALVVPHDSPIRTDADLRGKKVHLSDTRRCPRGVYSAQHRRLGDLGPVSGCCGTSGECTCADQC